MSVEYSANYGIGIELKYDNYADFIEKVEDIFYGENCECNKLFDYDRIGDCYSDGKLRIFVYIRNPFENGVDGLKEKIKDLKDFVKSNNLECLGDIDCIGGLLIH